MKSPATLFKRLPLLVRLFFAISSLLSSILLAINPVSPIVPLAAGLFLVGIGLVKVSGSRALLVAIVLVPLITGLFLANFDIQHPFIARYIGSTFFLVAIALASDTIRFEEWVAILAGSRITRAPLDTTLAVAVGRISVGRAVAEEIHNRKLARVEQWHESNWLNRLLDRMALPFRSLLESFEDLDLTLRMWRSKSIPSHTEPEEETSLIFSNSSRACSLSDVYDFPFFDDVIKRIFSAVSISAVWEEKLRQLSKYSTVLEIGAGTGRLTAEILKTGASVCAIERHKAFSDILQKTLSADDLTVISGAFPSGSLGEFDFVFLHQNVFLEILNQVGPEITLKAIRDTLKIGAQAVLDYPNEFTPEREGILYKEELPDIGQVLYAYEYLGQSSHLHRAILSYALERGRERFFVRTPLSFSLPPLASLDLLAREIGLKMQFSVIPDAYTLFPCQLYLVELTRLS
jgi:SAM-dependent methyltransferase